MFRRLSLIFCIGSLLAAVVLWWNPISSKMHNGGMLLALSLAWALGLFILWDRKKRRICLIALPVLATLPFLLPQSKIDQDQLRSAYVRNLQTLENTPYVWGGESSRGIDCSGLARKAMRNAFVGIGCRTLNGRAFWLATMNWWQDTSALALGQSYQDITLPLKVSGKIQTLDTSMLLPGDLAITQGGIRVLIYLGEDQWIQADPGAQKVVIEHGPTGDNPWFSQKLSMYRWTTLSHSD